MSEDAPSYAPFKPIFVDCTAGTNAFTDCVVYSAKEGKTRILGHAEMLFNRAETDALIAALMAARDAP